MISLTSLSQLCDCAKSLLGRQLLLPVDEEFVQSLHTSTFSTPFHINYRKLLTRTQLNESTASPGIPKLLFAYAGDAVVSSREGEFMGPLCSPMRKTHAMLLQSNQYFVSEKSDGTRVILVSHICPKFPSWTLRDSSGILMDSLPLDDVVTLEESRQFLCDNNTHPSASQEVQLSHAVFRMEVQKESSSSEVELFTLYPHREHQTDEVSEKNCLTAERRISTRHMAYCFDRSMGKAYLLLEEYKVPSLHSFVIDAELMVTVKTETHENVRLLLGCFDIYRYTDLKEGIQNDFRLTRWSMSKRYSVLKDLIIDPLHVSKKSSFTKPLLHIFAKEMLPLERFGECISNLQRHEINDGTSGVVYYYKRPCGVTKSDGFIFTPEKFDIVQGASKDQLKWKWPSMLSVDWSLTGIEGRKNEYVVDMFFRKRRFGHRPDSVGRVRLSSAMAFLNPLSLSIPTTYSVIAECVFDRDQNSWSIERIRSDKCEPNSVVTIISVLESLVEDINLGVLVDIIGMGDTLHTECVQHLQRTVHEGSGEEKEKENKNMLQVGLLRSMPEKKFCQLTLRATQLQTQGEHEIHLYWAVRLLGEKQHIPCVHCKVSECMGLGFACPVENKTSKLIENLYIALANAGGSYAWSDFTVSAVFDGSVGRWRIVSLQPNGDNRKSTCVGVIQHLQWLLFFGNKDERASNSHSKEENVQNSGESKIDSIVERTNLHYASKVKELSTGKGRSVLRQFNNWIKSLLITTSVSYVKLNSDNQTFSDRLAVADLCCGRGGDLFKWRAHKPRVLFMTDSCLEAVAEAAARYCVSKGLSLKVTPQDDKIGVPAYFCVCDVFDKNGALDVQLNEFFQKHLQERRLDIISCQFSIHYGCSTEERVCTFLRAVSIALRSGGVFVGTTVNDTELLRRVREYGSEFGNDVYQVKFSSDATQGTSFGVEYFVSIERSVSELPEYIVPWDHFVTLCKSFGLQLVESSGFLEYGELHYNSPLGQELRDSAGGNGKRDSDGHILIQLSPEEKEVAGLFRTFLFVKS
ncbi:mRNA (guanine-N(7))-methyltransferase domain [Trypanosoma melophagium]|uniref:mRNA (guanine-N(7))-methyltransferase domain n=1 Tax=Trypanosoma melophagium TaxID=715481 RepID=UPI00351A9C59|nr:mRNA (guanine-N(7))-methyltransferase domain [Trypanosoma melophagium]